VPIDPREEEELRNLVRRELEARQRLHRERTDDLRARRESGGFSEERRRIIEEEVEAFYREKGYRRYESDDGEVEWLSDDELLDRERQLPVDMEELAVEQRRVRNRFVFILLLGFCGVVLLFLLMRERSGSLQILCNVPGATVLLNGSPTEFVTDCRMDHLPTGPILISIAKYGYLPDGLAAKRVSISAGDTEVVVLKLKPQTIDSLGRPK
jgi:hypothetical protein